MMTPSVLLLLFCCERPSAVTPADRFAAATAFAVLHACDTMLVAPAAASVDAAAAIRDATRLVSAAAVRHGQTS